MGTGEAMPCPNAQARRDRVDNLPVHKVADVAEAIEGRARG
jgi:hypothetical protein